MSSSVSAESRSDTAGGRNDLSHFGHRTKPDCYSTDPGRRRAEIPEDKSNHALGSLRCLIAKLDARKLGRKAKNTGTSSQPEQTEKPKDKKWLSLKNEALWSQMWTVDR